jgi:hypothetical protein
MSASAVIGKVRQYPLAVVCLVVFVAMTVVIFVRGDVVDGLHVREQDLSDRLAVIKSNQDNAPGLQEQVEAIESKVAAFKARLFDREQRAINTDFFYNLENVSDVRILEVAQTAAEDPATAGGGPHELKLHDVIVFSVSIEGTFPEIVDFLYRLHRVEPFVRVADFDMRASRGARDSPDGPLAARLRVLVLARQSADPS